MNQKNFINIVLIIVIIILVGAVGYFAFIKKPTQVTAPASPTPQDKTTNWEIYANSKDCYTIKYNSPYRVWLAHNLVNYDADDPKYEMGDPNGVKIQIQKRDLNNGQTFASAMLKVNNNAAASDNNETRVEKYNLGNIQYTNRTLRGPGGTFDVFYSPSSDDESYFVILVWDIKNDRENVNLILSTFIPSCRQGT